jgi:hypothetical protein
MLPPMKFIGWALPCLLLAACAGGKEVCRRDAITGNERCQNVGEDYGEAAATAGVATGAWAVAGCTVNDCRPPYKCNPKTKMCEATTCETDAECDGFTCDTATGKCR